MSKPRREMNPRRTAKSIRTHEKTMKAYGDAAGWERYNSGTMAGKKQPINNNRGFKIGGKPISHFYGPEDHDIEDWDRMDIEDRHHILGVLASTNQQRIKAKLMKEV